MSSHQPASHIAGRYEIASRPMMGGMGIVYICLDRETDRPVALKTFKPEYLPDRAARDRFLREGTHWVDLGAHPHIVRCYEVLRIDPEVYLVLELVAKEQGREDASLRSWLTPGKPLPVEQALLFALQIVRGMAHAAERIPGFVHRDLKPENILVGADRLSQTATNRLRITDFGLTAILQETAIQTSKVSETLEVSELGRTQLTHGIVGTPLYMAPEQWNGEPVGAYTDVYALGCILYEMLAGQRAATGHSLPALRRAHCEGDLRLLPTDLPELVSALLTRCLALKSVERYTNWEAVGAALVDAYEAFAGRPAPSPAPAAALSRAEQVQAGWSYNAIGSSYLDIGKAEVALGYFERARAAGREEGEQRMEVAGLTHLGLTYARLGDARRAVGYHEQALSLARKVCTAFGENSAEWIASQRSVAAVLGNLGSAYLGLGDMRRAITYYEQCLAIHRRIGDRHGEGSALSNLVPVHRRLGNLPQAIECSNQALKVLSELGDRRGMAKVLGNLGLIYVALGDARRAIGYYEQQLAIAREIGDRHSEGAALGNLGIACYRLGAAQQAITYHEQALAIHRETGDRQGEGAVLGHLGLAHAALGDLKQTITYYERQLEIARDINDIQGEGAALGNLGGAHYGMGQVKQAIGYYEQALTILRGLGDQNGEGATLGNLGLAYTALGNATRAITYYEQALAVRRKIGDRQGEAFDCWNFGLLCEQQGDLTRAAELMQVCVDFEREVGHPNAEEDALRVAQIRAALR